MFIVKYRKIFFVLSSISILLSVYAFIVKGFNAGIDFKGGSISEVTYDKRPDVEVLKAALDKAGFPDARIQMAGDTDMTLKTKTLTEADHQKLLTALTVNGTL